MAKYRVKETFKVTQWTTVDANTEEEALDKIDNEVIYYEEEIDRDHLDTDYSSLEKI